MGTLSGVNLHLVNSFEKAQEFKRWLGERRPLSVLGLDTETSGLDCYAPDAAIRLIQFGDGMDGWSIPWEFWKGLALETLENWEGDWVLHNQDFDVGWIEQHSMYRFKQHQLNDSMLQAHIIDPLGPAGLKPLSRKLVDPRATLGESRLHSAMVDNKWTWATVPIEFAPYWQYSSLDPVLAYRLHEIFQKRVGPGTEYAQVYDLEMATRFICTKMEQRGARVDLEYCRQTGGRLHEHAQNIKQWGKDSFGVLLSSNQQLIKWFQDQGEEITVFSEKTGMPSVDKWQLQIFENSENSAVAMVAEQVLAMRRAGKTASSYFDNILEYAVPGPDGDVVHPNIRTLGARTSRMSIAQPALQQLPHGDATVRNAFIAREGRQLISTDFEQVELRILAHLSKDAMLQDAFRTADATGGDFFVEVGKEIYRDPQFSKADKRRGLVKSTIYGLNYGAGTAKMAETAGVLEEQMIPIVHALEARYPGLKRFMKNTERLGRERESSEGQGYIITPYGRRLPCDEGMYYTLTNYSLQGHAAEVFKKSLVDLDAAGWNEFFVVPVHDEILMDVPNDLVETAKIEVPRIMENLTDYAIPILAASEGGYTRWGERYE